MSLLEFGIFEAELGADSSPKQFIDQHRGCLWGRADLTGVPVSPSGYRRYFTQQGIITLGTSAAQGGIAPRDATSVC